MKSILYLLMLFGADSFAATSRIESKVLDRSKVQRVFVVPGKPLFIEFPCNIQFALPGTKTDLEIKVGINHKNNLTFWAHSMSDVTGINVKCGEDMVVFDVIPHKSKYQRFIKVTSITSGKGFIKKRLISSSKSPEEVVYSGKKKRIMLNQGGL